MPTTTTINLTPTKQGFAHMARMFAEEAKLAHARAARVEALLDREDFGRLTPQDLDLVHDALSAFHGAELHRAARLEEAAAEAQRGAA